MTDRVYAAAQTTEELLVAAIRKVKGIVEVAALPPQERRRVQEIEQDAEQRSLMGLGKVVNSGVREVLACDLVYTALTSMDFDWGCQASLVMKKGDELVGEEVRDEETIKALSGRRDVWFMHRNFVVYKDKVSFPEDIMNKVCYFEIPCLPARWCIIEDDACQCNSIVYANPSTACDLFIKEHYFSGRDEQGLGTILVGVRL